MLECENGSFYTGYTKNLTRRFRQHLDGTANVKYTRSHKPIRIAQCWRLYESVGCALKVEKLIKTAGRPVKEWLVREPDELRQMASVRMDTDIPIFTNNPGEIENAARELANDEVKTAPDPFAWAGPVDL